MRYFGLLIVAVAISACSPQSTKQNAGSTEPTAAAADVARTQIADALKETVAGWKAGDVKRFMSAYSDSADTIFVTDRGIAKGKSQMEQNYVDSGAFSEESRRGDMATEVVDFRMVGPDHAMAVVKYSWTPEKGPAVPGYSTLLFQKQADGWKVIVDHSAAARSDGGTR